MCLRLSGPTSIPLQDFNSFLVLFHAWFQGIQLGIHGRCSALSLSLHNSARIFTDLHNMHRVRHAVSSRQLAVLLWTRRQGSGGSTAQRCSVRTHSACVPACKMPVSKRTVAVDGFEELGTEVWEVCALTDPQVHILIIPGNPGSAGSFLHDFNLVSGAA